MERAAAIKGIFLFRKLNGNFSLALAYRMDGRAREMTAFRSLTLGGKSNFQLGPCSYVCAKSVAGGTCESHEPQIVERHTVIVGSRLSSAQLRMI